MRILFFRMRFKKQIVLNVALLKLLMAIYIYLEYEKSVQFLTNSDEIIDFEGFDNVSGMNMAIIPNIVHLLYLNQPFIRFYQLVNILSIYYNHEPDFIYIHCDDCNFRGKYFDKLRKQKSLWNIIRLHKIPFKETIFGVKYK
jgi:hypothetical protein